MNNDKLKQILRDGYRGGTMTGDKDRAKVTLHYTTVAQADRALDALADTLFGAERATETGTNGSQETSSPAKGKKPQRMKWTADNGMEDDPNGVWCRFDVAEACAEEARREEADSWNTLWAQSNMKKMAEIRDLKERLAREVLGRTEAEQKLAAAQRTAGGDAVAMRKALRPFAKIAKHFADNAASDHIMHEERGVITVAHLRAAEKAVAAQPVPEAAVCDNCDGKGGWKTGEWIDPVSGPECSAERCEVCEGTGKLPEAAAQAEDGERRDLLSALSDAINVRKWIHDVVPIGTDYTITKLAKMDRVIAALTIAAAPTEQPTPAKTVEFDGIAAQPTPPDDELRAAINETITLLENTDGLSKNNIDQLAHEQAQALKAAIARAALRQPPVTDVGELPEGERNA